MTEQELKTIIQALLDGRVIQYKRVDLGIPQEFTDFPECNITALLRTALCGTNMLFRVKPEVKTFKYKTRPYEVVYHDKVVALGIWSSAIHLDTEQAFGDGFSGSNFYKSFRWLAHATEHEVEYE